MFYHTHQQLQLQMIAIFASILSSAVTTASYDEVLLVDENVNQPAAYYSHSLLFAAFDSSSLVDLQQLLQSEAFKQNMSLTLNISADNLTELLSTAQLNQTWQFEHQQHTMLVLISLSIFYALIIVAGLVGNLVTCIVIARNKFMHTATNYYLFNLAISDFMLLATGAPQDVYSYWRPNDFPFSDAVCILASVLAETATNATVLTITAFTVERYIAICHPFRQHSMSKLSRAIKFIFAIWMTAVVLALPQAMQFSVVVEPSGTSCTIGNHFKEHVFALSGFIFFVGPMTAICVLYILIGLKLKRSRMIQTAPRRNFDMNRGVSSQGRVIRMLFAVAVAFFLCWAPFHAQRLMAVYGSSANIESKLFRDVFDIVDMVSGMMYYLSTCINPLLYNLMSHKFRDAFKVTLGRRFGFPGRSQSHSHNYSALLRQNGSMRLHTTVNSNALDNYQSYRAMHSHCRDHHHHHHHLSLQDSIRTTTTTTTMSSSTGMGSSVCGNNNNNSSLRSSHCSRYNSTGSQSPLKCASRTKHENGAGTNQVNGTAATHTHTQICQQHNKLQSQISQLSQRSNGGDSNSLMDMELGAGHNYSHAYPSATTTPATMVLNSNSSHNNNNINNNNVHRTIISNGIRHNGSRIGKLANDDRDSMNSTEWKNDTSQYEPNNDSERCRGSERECDLTTNPLQTPNSLAMARRPPKTNDQQPIQPVQPVQPLQLVNTIAELRGHTPARTRLKLSRIISRRDQDILHAASPRTELIRSNVSDVPGASDVPDSPFTTYENDKKKHVRKATHGGGGGRRTYKTLDTLASIFHWRARKKELTGRRGAGGGNGKKRTRHNSTTSTRHIHANGVGTPTPRVALMRSISSAAPGVLESTLNAEIAGQK